MTNQASHRTGLFFAREKAPHSRGLSRLKVIYVIAQPGKNPVALGNLYERTETLPRTAKQFKETHKRLPQRSLAPPPLPGKAAVLLKGVSAFSEPGVYRPFPPGAFSRRGKGAEGNLCPSIYVIPQNP